MGILVKDAVVLGPEDHKRKGALWVQLGKGGGAVRAGRG